MSDILHDKNKLKDFLIEGSVEKNADYDSNIKSIFDPIIKNFAAAWLIKCLTKYDESEFHRRFSESYIFNGQRYKGFDFIADMEQHHKKMWFIFRKMAPKMGDVLLYDDMKFLHKVTSVLELKGWKLQFHEIQCIHHIILMIKKVVYP